MIVFASALSFVASVVGAIVGLHCFFWLAKVRVMVNIGMRFKAAPACLECGKDPGVRAYLDGGAEEGTGATSFPANMGR